MQRPTSQSSGRFRASRSNAAHRHVRPQDMTSRSTVIAMFLGSLNYGQYATACSCVSTSPEERYQSAEHIFMARVTAASEAFDRVKYYESGTLLIEEHSAEKYGLAHGNAVETEEGYLQLKVKLIETFKGNPIRLPSLRSGYASPDCGFQPLVGFTFIFYANKDGAVSTCSGSKIYVEDDDASSAEIRELRTLR